MCLIKKSYPISMLILGSLILLFISCEKQLDSQNFGQFDASSFFQTAEDAEAATVASYRGLGDIFGMSDLQATVQSAASTDEMICDWGGDYWNTFDKINFREDFESLWEPYLNVLPVISEITINIDRIGDIEMDEERKAELIGQLKGLRGIYSYELYNLYGPVSVVMDAEKASDPDVEIEARPSQEEMVSLIETDLKEAADALPVFYEGNDYGRVTKGAVEMALLKLYMHDKRWEDAVSIAEEIETQGFDLIPVYKDNFTDANKEGNSELMLVIPCDEGGFANAWTMGASPANYVNPDGALANQWDGFKMRWPTYDKFEENDSRKYFLYDKYPTKNGEIFDARANGSSGAMPLKYKPHPGSEQGNENIIIWRYADVMLLLAEALNEVNEGPTPKAYKLVNDIRDRAGLDPIPDGLNKAQFLDKIKDERLFELWMEGSRREDLIRWGDYIQRAIDDGSTTAKPEFVLYPIPRTAINESGGVIKQNPGYLGN